MPRPAADSQSPQTRVISLGCRLNIAEGEAMRLMAKRAGVDDCVIINSCAVTHEAVRRTRQTIRKARREKPGARIIVTGCAAQIDAQAFGAIEEVDAVIGNAEKMAPRTWADLAAFDAAGQTPVIVDDIMNARETAAHLIDGYGDRARAFLQIQNGCDHRCTFCIIPYGRGPARSVPPQDAVDAVNRLVDAGHKEVVLTGVDMTSWGADLGEGQQLGDLVGAILDGAPALFRLRLSSVDCAEIDAALFDRLVQDDRMAPHLHLSLQSGADLILKRMKRRHNRGQAIRLAERLRARRPEISLGADFIAGFPTEDEAMFADTLGLIDDAGINFVHAFPFSPRKGTPAARMPQLDRRIIHERAARLRAKASEATRRFLDSLVGAEETGVIESGRRVRLGNFAAVSVVSLSEDASGIARVRIDRRGGDQLRGSLVR